MAEELSRQTFTGKMTSDEVKKLVRPEPGDMGWTIASQITRLLPLVRPVEDLVAMLTVADGMCYSLRDSFVQYVLPYLSEQEMQEWRERLRPHLTLANWPTGWNRPPATFDSAIPRPA